MEEKIKMATKKTTAEQVKVAMAKVEAAKAAEAAKTDAKAEKAPAKKTTTKVAAEKKAPAKKTTTKAAEKKAPAKKATTKVVAEKKAPAKATEKKAPAKTVAKKAPAKKTVKATQTVVIQACGYEVTTADVTAKVVDIVGKKVKELNIYVKPEEGMIYYTADGEQGSVTLA